MEEIREKVTQLASLLECELNEHRVLTETARKMNEALHKRDVGAVRTHSSRYDECTCRIEEMEEKRLEICDALTKLLGHENRHLTLPSIIDRIPTEFRSELTGLRTALKAEIAKLTKLNMSNQVFLEESLITVAQTVKILAAGRAKTVGYKQGGKPTEDAGNRTIINRTA